MGKSLDSLYDSQSALKLLQAGNAAYLAGKRPALATPKLRQSLAAGQQPYACIVTCSDSRINPEDIFCAEIGSLFIIRTAGNTIGASELASLAYASHYLNVPLALVMGHTHCGAVEAALAHNDDGHLQHFVSSIQAAIGNEAEPRRCELINARYWAKQLAATDAFLTPTGEKKIVAALYEIETGKVVFDI